MQTICNVNKSLVQKCIVEYLPCLIIFSKPVDEGRKIPGYDQLNFNLIFGISFCNHFHSTHTFPFLLNHTYSETVVIISKNKYLNRHHLVFFIETKKVKWYNDCVLSCSSPNLLSNLFIFW